MLCFSATFVHLMVYWTFPSVDLIKHFCFQFWFQLSLSLLSFKQIYFMQKASVDFRSCHALSKRSYVVNLNVNYCILLMFKFSPFFGKNMLYCVHVKCVFLPHDHYFSPMSSTWIQECFCILLVGLWQGLLFLVVRYSLSVDTGSSLNYGARHMHILVHVCGCNHTTKVEGRRVLFIWCSVNVFVSQNPL